MKLVYCTTVATAVLLSLLLSAVSPLTGAHEQQQPNPPVPTPDILEWTKLEVGAFYSFNMISMLDNISNTQYFCLGVGGGGGWLPDPNFFNPEKLDLDQWLATAKSFGAKYAVLVAQHCSGFSMWPTDVFDETGFEYTYSTKSSSFRGGGYDVVKEFIISCQKAGVKPGIYYSLNQNYYLNSGHGIVKNTTLVPGQVKVSQELYGKIVLAQMKELWSNYGPLTEIWFDGGCSVPGISDQISALLDQLQPHAVYFGGCAKSSNLRWIGTESGMPGYPIWSTAQDCRAGQGDPNGNIFCPAESDTTLQEGGHWFQRDGFAIRSLDELKQVYLKTVGQNTNLLLNTAANNMGLIVDASVQRYKEFGDWIESCFSNSSILAQNSGKGYILKVQSEKSLSFDTIVIQEDQTNGQAVRNFTVELITQDTLNRAAGSKGLTEGRDDKDGPLVVASGSSIGHKAIFTMATAATGEGVVLNITQAAFEPLVSLSLHFCNKAD